ncbi:hypothetical protein HZB06_01165 [Candidatus Wolfebacteria bacterium]|nr:hypothetical protein [Candidatus Wolfebacteria bacterium]
MNNIPKQIIAIIVTGAALAAIYLGSYLPLRKSQMHIDVVLSLQSGKVNTLEDFNDLFDPALDFYSPIGQDEITQYYLGILINIINQQSDKTIADILARQAENRTASILKAGKGFSFNQNLYTLGSIYKIVALKFKDEGYYQKSVNIFQEGLKYSPDRLIFLGGLFNLYVAHGYNDKAREIGNVILRYYPNEESVRKFVDSNK